MITPPMAPNYQTPGVYINEINAFSNSITGVSTNIPVFIGHTETALFGGKSWLSKPFSIASVIEYEQVFGRGPGNNLQFSLQPAAANVVAEPLQPLVNMAGRQMQLALHSPAFYLYNSLRLYFLNGGGPCYIISVGDYTGAISLVAFTNALEVLKHEQHPSILVIPDAVALPAADYAALVNQSLDHCGLTQNKVAILDVQGGAIADATQTETVIENFRNTVQSPYLAYGAAYFPWVKTGVVTRSEISFLNLPADTGNYLENTPSVQDAWANALALRQANPTDTTAIATAQTTLVNSSPAFKQLMDAALDLLNVLPASGAVAAAYVSTDNMVSVSKAPANISLSAVLAPTVAVSNDQNMAMNIPTDGKAVNVLRAFPLKGVLIWGARTLDGNSNDWRYVNVRRTLIYIEQSIKQGIAFFVFEPNTAPTWQLAKTTIENFLQQCWQQGILAGAKPEEAFSVNIGLGTTMTADDLLNGVMNISVNIAISHPAEFICINFQQLMQIS